METNSAFCEVETGVLYVIYINVSLQNVNLSTTLAVFVMIFEAEICVFSHPGHICFFWI
jgi:hypothetical protein